MKSRIEFMKVMLKKKRFLYPLIFFLELMILMTISNVFEIETGNTSLYALISQYILIGTLIWFSINIVKEHKEELRNVMFELLQLPIALYCIYFWIGILILVLFGISIMFLLENVILN